MAFQSKVEQSEVIDMTESIIVAVITGLFALLGTVLTVRSGNQAIMNEMKIHQAVQDEKIVNLTNEVRKHNDFATRVPILEEQVRQLQKGA